MLSITSKSDGCGIDIKTKPLRFWVSLFKKKKHINAHTSNNMDGSNHSVGVARIPSTLSVREVHVSGCPVSPLSTPARNRDINTDMEALRISRHDNPFLKQVLASRESLVESLEESESDDINLMSQEYLSELDADPLSLPEVHEHMIRSPPPISWPHSPNFKIFRFPNEAEASASQEVGRKSPLSRCISPRLDTTKDHSQDGFSSKGGVTCLLSPRLMIPSRPHQRSSSDIRERNFTLLTPAPLRSLTDVRRLRSDEDSQQLVNK